MHKLFVQNSVPIGLIPVPYQKYSYPTKYPCSDCAIYRLNTQFGAKMEIEIYRYQKFVVLALIWEEFYISKTFHEVLIY